MHPYKLSRNSTTNEIVGELLPIPSINNINKNNIKKYIKLLIYLNILDNYV